FKDPEARLPAQLLAAWPTLADVAEAASGAGVRVSVVQACSHTEHLARNGVQYHFLPFRSAFSLPGRGAAMPDMLRRLQPDVLHVNGLGFPRQVRALAAMQPNVPIILQDHASAPPRFWRRRSWRRGMSVAAGIAFCALEQAQPFTRAGMTHALTRLYEVPESTSRFTPGARDEARRIAAIDGDPAVLW